MARKKDIDILDEIFANKRKEVVRTKEQLPFDKLRLRALRTPEPPSFLDALVNADKPAPRLIAEVKKQSPSKGIMRQNFDPIALATTYAQNGAAAISVLTDRRYFGGTLGDLRMIAEEELGIPLLRKDFLYDVYQIYEARVVGASAILIIAAMLKKKQIKLMIDEATGLALTPLVEVHNEAELEMALECGATLIGINNRDLKTFRTRLEVTERLRPLIPEGIPVVGESGIHTEADVQFMANVGVDAMLIGEGIVTAKDTAAAVQMFSQTAS